MKILFHTINYIPELTGIGKFSGEMGSWFAEQGHDVRVVTTPPYYPEWKIRAGYRKYWYAREMIKGAKVIRCPFWVPEHPTGLKRILHLASFSLSA
ncbi:MAG: colanic acid biosynthesis glycosyltransferase WcaI, partial [Rhodospirillales bacterium]|nr:colanic acid biosynthesis glycosyltransferase WcaI [Rhodospirillales bacterium]